MDIEKLQRILSSIRTKEKQMVYPSLQNVIAEKNEAWINCGNEVDLSTELSGKLRINMAFNDFLKEQGAACGLRMVKTYKKNEVWRLQIRW